MTEQERINEKYKAIVEVMNGVIMNPPPNCHPIKSTSRKRVNETLYEIQHIIGNIRFVNEEPWEKGAKE